MIGNIFLDIILIFESDHTYNQNNIDGMPWQYIATVSRLSLISITPGSYNRILRVAVLHTQPHNNNNDDTHRHKKTTHPKAHQN